MKPSPFASLPVVPCYAVIFSSIRTEGDRGYGAMAERMVELARQQPGFLGIESARGEDGFGLTVSYWASLEAIGAWRTQADHLLAQRQGREQWYEQFAIRVARVEREHGLPGHLRE
jgi:heme-degrading monooxygenase HmoA